MQRYLQLICVAMATAACAANSGPLSEKPPKKYYASNREVGLVAQCLTSRLQWLAPPAMAPAQDGDMRVIFSSNGKVFTDLLVRHGQMTKIEARGVVGGRVNRTIESCL